MSTTTPHASSATSLHSAETMRRERVASGVSKVLSEAAPRKGRAILFGSRARGDARRDSD